jgi:hypothetical protein
VSVIGLLAVDAAHKHKECNLIEMDDVGIRVATRQMT